MSCPAFGLAETGATRVLSVRKAYRRVRSVGPVMAARLAARRLLGRTAHPGLAGHLTMVDHAHALEVGGPSDVFKQRGIAPVYQRLATCDDVDYADRTIWSAGDASAQEYRPEGRVLGTRIMREATRLDGISGGTYDLVMASHVLEHVANPLKALTEWGRVLRKGGVLLLVVPDMRRTFDHGRAVTPLNHLREDLARDVGEDDTTHVQEVLEKHDVRRDPGLSSREELLSRTRENLQNRAVHHHVFTLDSFRAMLTDSGLQVLFAATAPPYHLLALARKGEA